LSPPRLSSLCADRDTGRTRRLADAPSPAARKLCSRSAPARPPGTGLMPPRLRNAKSPREAPGAHRKIGRRGAPLGAACSSNCR
jgi:hypothetical protein